MDGPSVAASALFTTNLHLDGVSLPEQQVAPLRARYDLEEEHEQVYLEPLMVSDVKRLALDSLRHFQVFLSLKVNLQTLSSGSST